jgi:secondary thiamine-phosphate synthase enzyme
LTLLNLVEKGLEGGGLVVAAERLTVRSRERIELLDITDAVNELVAGSGVGRGLVHVQSRHTTTGVVVNENEPLLLEDFRRLLEAWAPRNGGYRHDELDRRTDVPPGERPNGDAHVRALLLGGAQTLEVGGGELQLGRWQRLFLVELDGPRQRTLSLVLLGRARDRSRGPAPVAPLARRARR